MGLESLYGVWNMFLQAGSLWAAWCQWQRFEGEKHLEPQNS